MSSKVLFKPDLDAASCGAPGCTHDHSVIFLHSGCHPTDPVTVHYDKKAGQLIVACYECGAVVVRIVPAGRLE